jgi:hypothetical protein
MNLYIGPIDVYRRFLAGLSVTHQNLLEDVSLWSVVPTQRYQLERMAAVIQASEVTCGNRSATSSFPAPKSPS